MKSHNYCPEFYVTEISMISQPKEVFPHGGKARADHRPHIQTRPSFGHDVCLLSCPEAEIHRGQCLVHDSPQSQGWCQCQFSDQGLVIDYSAGWQALRQKVPWLSLLKAQTLPVKRIYTLDNYLQKVHLSWWGTMPEAQRSFGLWV